MHLKHEKFLARHRIKIAVEAIDDHDSCVLPLNGIAHDRGELARRHLGRVDLLNYDATDIDVCFEPDVQALCPPQDRADTFVKHKHHGTILRRTEGLNIRLK